MNKKHCGQQTKVGIAKQYLYTVIASMMLIISITACPVSVDGPNIKNGPLYTENSPVQRIASTDSLGTVFPDPSTSGPWDTQAKARPIDMDRVGSVGLIYMDSSKRYIANFQIASDVRGIVRSRNESYSLNTSVPGKAVIFTGDLSEKITQSKASLQNYYFAHVDVKKVDRTVYIKDPNPAVLMRYATEEFLNDVLDPHADPYKIAGKYPWFFPVKCEIAGIIDVTLVSNKSEFSSIDSYRSALSAGVNSIDGLGVNANVGSSDGKEVQQVSNSSSACYKLIGIPYTPDWHNYADVIAGIPQALATIDNTSYAAIPSMENVVYLWQFVAVKNPMLANELFKIFIRQNATLAISLDSTFGGWLETVKFTSPGYNIVNLPLGLYDMLILYAGSGSGGDAGDYKWQVNSGFPMYRTDSGYNGGPPGQSGSGAYAFYQPYVVQYNEDEEVVNGSNLPRYVQLRITVGSGGSTGTNTSGTNKSGKGGNGSPGGDTIVEVVGEDSTLLKITVFGGAGGYYSHNSTAASISPENFEGLFEYKSALGIGTQGAIVNGIKIGADSSCKPGMAIYQVLRLN